MPITELQDTSLRARPPSKFVTFTYIWQFLMVAFFMFAAVVTVIAFRQGNSHWIADAVNGFSFLVWFVVGFFWRSTARTRAQS